MTSRPIQIHEIKAWPDYFQDIFLWRKRFDVRLNDRGYQVGDVVVFKEWDPNGEEYTGHDCERRIGYIFDPDDFLDKAAGLTLQSGVQSGFVVLGLENTWQAVPVPGVSPPIVNQGFPFQHYMVPESMKEYWREHEMEPYHMHVTTFPDEWIPAHIQVVEAPVFTVERRTGNVVYSKDMPTEIEADVISPEELKEKGQGDAHRIVRPAIDAKTVLMNPVGSRTKAFWGPTTGDSPAREALIKNALAVAMMRKELRYFYAILERRDVHRETGELFKKVEIIVRGCK